MKRLLNPIVGSLLLLAALSAGAQTNHWHYPFDGDCADVGPNGQAGSASPGVTFVAGHKGACARFAGSDFVDLPLDFNQTAELSYAFWMKLEGAQPGPYYAMLLSSDADTYGRGYAISLENDDCQIWLDDRMVDTGIPPPEVGQWQHVCVTYAPGQVVLYLNGQAAYVYEGYTNALPFGDSTNLLVGLRNLFFDRGANASIDELEIFDRAIGAEEVSGLVYGDQTLLAHYKFENDVLDSSPNAFHGTPSTDMVYEDSIHGRGLVLPPPAYVRLPVDLNPYGAISFSFWMKINGPPAGENRDYGMFFSTDNNTFGRGLGVNADDNRFMVWYDDGYEYLDEHVPEVGVWRHVGMTYEPGRACFYVDGQLVHVNTEHAGLPPYNDATDVTLGIRNLFCDRGADFSIDELRIYRQALSSNEMQSIFDLGLTVTGIVVSGTSAIKPERTSAFACQAGTADGQMLDVTGSAEFRIEPETATNVVWFVGNVLHVGPAETGTTFHVYALYEHASGIVTSALHEVALKTDDSDCLLAYYPLDGNAFDASGNAYDGEVCGANVATDAVAGACYAFTGRNWISLPVDLNACEELSYSLWFQIAGTQPGPYYSMLFSTDNNTWGRGISITLTNSDFLFWFDDSFEDTSVHTPTVGEWHQLTCTYRPGENVFYFDGVESYRDVAHAGSAPYNDATNVLLGLRNLFFDRGFNGKIDEVKIFRCALASNSVWENYVADAGGVVNQAPLISVAVDPTGGVAPCKITFDFAESHDPDGWIVRSEVDQENDGLFEQAVAGAGRLSVDYLRPGEYLTGLRVVDNFGAMATCAVQIAVGGQAPGVVLSADPDQGAAPLTVTFTAQVAPVSTNVPIVSYEWDFDGDGTADALSDGPTSQHVYGEEGMFVARVSVLDAAGVGSQAECTVTVAESSTPPVCSPTLEFFPHTGFSPLAVDLRVLGAGACGFREIAWDFDGDGLVDEITGSSSNAHLYAEPGKYWPTASVVFDDGAAIVLSNLLQVSESSGLKVWISQPKDGQVVSGSALALHANTAPGNLTGAVRFQYRVSDSSEWQDIGSWIEPPPFSFQQEWDASAFTDGTIVFLRAVARDTADVQVISDTVQIQIQSSIAGHPGAVQASDDQIQCAVDAAQRSTYDQADGFGFSVTPMTVDADGLLTITSSAPIRGARAASAAGRSFLPQSYAIDYGSKAFNQALQLVIPYADADDDGFVDGTWIPEATLDAYVRTGPDQAWQKANRSDIDVLNNRVRTEIAGSCEVRLAGNPNLLLPQHGCALAAGGAETANPPRYAADGNDNSCWRSAAAGLPQEFVFAFTNDEVAVLDRLAFLNSGSADGAALRSFRIETSLDGVQYATCIADSLATGAEPQEWDAGDVVCRYIKLVALDGQTSDGAALNEFAALGSLTTDSDADGLEDVWEIRCFASLANDGASDPDQDGLTTAQEAQLGLSPAAKDTDGDGYDDRSEWVAGTGGDDGDAHLNLTPKALDDAGDYLFRWLSATGRVYMVMNSTNLHSWATIPAYVVHGDGSVMYFTNSIVADGTVFYRLQVDFE